MKITNRFIKFLIILNGLMLPILVGFGIYQISKEFFPNRNNNLQGVIIGEKLEEAKKDSVALQGLRYYDPSKIYNSENYLLKISLMSYKERKRLNKLVSVSNDVGDGLLNLVNVIFLNKDYQVISSLLNKKASILEIKYRGDYYRRNEEVDKSYKNIGYLIAFEDSNKDGKLNSRDNHDLYISDLNGKNLKKVTSNIDINRFEFINSNSQVLIHYKEREDIPEEHKKVKFAIYNIKKESFINLQSLNSEIDMLEKIIIE